VFIFFGDFRFGRGSDNLSMDLRLLSLSIERQGRGATSKRGGLLISDLPDGLNLLILFGQTTLGVVAVLVEVGGQALTTLLLSLAALEKILQNIF